MTFPPGVDGSRTGVSGRLVGVVPGYVSGRPTPAGAPVLAGVVVRIIDFRRPGDARPSRYYGSAISGADGRWTITGVPPGTEYGVDLQCFWPTPVGAPGCTVIDTTWQGRTTGSFQIRPIVANQIVQDDDTVLERKVLVSPATGSLVAAGPVTFSWPAVGGATVYCVGLGDNTAGMQLSVPTGNCGRYQASTAEIQTTSWASPPLVAGHEYLFTVWAFDRTPDTAALLERGVSFTRLGSGFSKILAR